MSVTLIDPSQIKGGAGIYHVKGFGAVGNGVADDTSAINAAAAFAASHTPAILVFDPGEYKTTAAINLLGASNLAVQGYGAILRPSGSTGFTVFTSVGGVVTALTTVAVDVNYPNRELSVAPSITLSSATGLAVGDYVYLHGTEGANAFSQIARIKTLAGVTLTPYGSVKIPIRTTDASSVSKVTLASNLSIRGLTIDGTNCIGSGTYNPMIVSLYRDSFLADLTIQNFAIGANSPGLFTVYLFNCFYQSINVINCGGGGGAAGFYIWWNTDCGGDQIHIRESVQFGFEPVQCTGLQFTNVSAIGVTGRAAKISGCAHSCFTNIEGSDSDTGLYVMTGSFNNLLTNARGFRNVGGPGFGVGTSGEDNRNNTFTNVAALNNGDQDLIIGSTDKHTTFLGVTTLGSTVNNGGTGVIIDWADPVTTAAASAGVATANSLRCVITSEALATGAGSAYILTLVNSRVGPSSVVMVSVDSGSGGGANTQGIPSLGQVKPLTGSVQISVNNLHATQAFNGTIVISVSVAPDIS